MTATPFRIIISDEVHSQLTEIYEFISLDSVQDAESLIHQVFKAIESLKYFPMRTVVAGQKRAAIPLRSIPVRSFVVYFDVLKAERTVNIVYVSRGAKLLPRRFLKSNLRHP